MQNRPNVAKWLFTAIGLTLLVLAISLWASGDFEKCIHAAPEDHTGKQNSEGLAFLLLLIGHWFGCMGRWSDVNSAPITAVAAATTGIFTFVLAFSTIGLWRETERLAQGADDQSGKMEASLKESARAATAMEGVAAAMGENVESAKESVATSKEIAIRQKQMGELQLRAYVSAIIGGGLYQDRAHNLKFQGNVTLLNDGQTPAHKVTHIVNAGVFPAPLPDGFEFPNMGSKVAGDNMIGPRQNRSLSGVVDSFVPDEDVDAIKKASGRGLYVWGYVRYTDVFEQPHETTFCILVTWLPNGNVWGYYTPNRNNAT